MSEELTRFPITPQDRHRTAQSFDDVHAVPEENLPRQGEQPQDGPLPPGPDDVEDDGVAQSRVGRVWMSARSA
ncbi:hypothetical protein BH23ACT10_BH23ACT10_34030 [soil metagenome]